MGWRYIDQSNDVVHDTNNEQDMSNNTSNDDDDDNSIVSQVPSSTLTSSSSSASMLQLVTPTLVRPIPIRPSEYKYVVFGSNENEEQMMVLEHGADEDEKEEDDDVDEDTLSEHLPEQERGLGQGSCQPMQNHSGESTNIDSLIDRALSVDYYTVLDRPKNPSPPSFYTSSAFWDVERKLSNISSRCVLDDMMTDDTTTDAVYGYSIPSPPVSCKLTTTTMFQGVQPMLYTPAFLAIQVIPLGRWDCSPLLIGQEHTNMSLFESTVPTHSPLSSSSSPKHSMARPIPLRVVDVQPHTTTASTKSSLDTPPASYMAIG